MAGWRHQHRRARWLGRMLVALSLATSCGVLAEGIITPSATAKGYVEWNPAYYASTIWYRSQQEECEAEALAFAARNSSYSGAYCTGVSGINSREIMFPNLFGPGQSHPSTYWTNVRYVCPTGYSTPSTTWDQSTAPWTPTVTCHLASCPVNSTGTPPSCTCATGYQPDSTKTSCVPIPTCTVTTKIDEITDPVAQLYDNGTYNDRRPDLVHLTQETQSGLACIQQKVAASNCYMTPRPTSGYRPTAYQTHIREVYDKWQLIKDDNTLACAETKAAIGKEFKRHSRFARRPGSTSNHSQVDAQGNPAGNAVDITGVPDSALDSADAIACQCNMYRPLINMPDPTKNDPIHYQPRTCPR